MPANKISQRKQAPAKPAPPQEGQKRMDPKAIENFFAILEATRPTPRTELHYSSPFTLLVAVMLSAQSTDARVNLVTAKLFPIAKEPQEMLDLGVEKLTQMIQSIGLYRTKAKNLIATSQMLLERHDGQVPGTREALEQLPGVGRKSANVVLNVIFGQPTMPVDTHIFRLCNRTGLAPGKTVRQVEEQLLEVVPEKFAQHAHHWLVLHGRYICKARNPQCPHCPTREICLFEDKTEKKTLTPKQKKTPQAHGKS